MQQGRILSSDEDPAPDRAQRLVLDAINEVEGCGQSIRRIFATNILTWPTAGACPSANVP